jgi:hypothetical protein
MVIFMLFGAFKFFFEKTTMGLDLQNELQNHINRTVQLFIVSTMKFNDA